MYKCNKQSQDVIVKRHYNEATLYHNTSNLSVTKIRKVCSDIEHSKSDILKMGNPAKVMFDTEEDLLVALGI